MQKYVVRSKVDKSGDEAKKLYYGVPVLSEVVGVNELASEICYRCSLSEGDVLAAIRELGKLMQYNLTMGNSIYLETIGTFSLSGVSEGVDSPDKCTPSKIRPGRICFRADKHLNQAKAKMKYEQTERKNHYKK